MIRSVFVFMLVTLLPVHAYCDGILISWGPNDLTGMTEERFNGARERSVPELLKLNKNLESWPEAYELLIGVMQHRDDAQLRRGLMEQLVPTRTTRLKQTSRLIIWERISSGDILFEGKGLQVDDDLFSSAGRANWCLRNMTERNFGIIRIATTQPQLVQLQSKWRRLLSGEAVEETRPHFPSKTKGMTEIRSLRAIEALITSLRTNPRKELYIKSTLKNLYDLDELPEEEDSPAHCCNPDTYTHFYLATVTEISDEHSAEWWNDWWNNNKSRLAWDADSAKFRVKE